MVSNDAVPSVSGSRDLGHVNRLELAGARIVDQQRLAIRLDRDLARQLARTDPPS